MARFWNEAKQKYVGIKNLGFLLRHWKEVSSFTITPHENGSGAQMIASFKDNKGFYICQWVDYDHCLLWLKRPVFIGVPCNGRAILPNVKKNDKEK